MPRWWKIYSLIAEGEVDVVVRQKMLKLQSIARTMVGVPLMTKPDGEMLQESESHDYICLKKIPLLTSLDATTKDFFERSPIHLPFLKILGTYWETGPGKALLRRVQSKLGVVLANQFDNQSTSQLHFETETMSPFGLTQEIKLAQVHSLEDVDSNNGDCFPIREIDWSSEGSNNSETSENLAIMDDLKRNNVWSSFASLHSQCIDSIKCVKGYKIYRDYLHAAHAEIMALSVQNTTVSGQQAGQQAMAGLPAVSKYSQSNRRTKRLSSPKKRRKASRGKSS
jgi:hypothetical protein